VISRKSAPVDASLNDVWFGGDEAGGLRVSRTAVMVRVLVASAGRCLAVASGQVVRIELPA
jgi:hypothetical protein